MNQTTPGTEAGFDLDKPILTQAAFEEIAESWDGCEGEGIKDIGAALRRDFDRLARRAAPDSAAQPVQAGEAADVKPWGERLPLCPNEHQIRAAMEAEIAELRASLAPVSAQQGAAKARFHTLNCRDAYDEDASLLGSVCAECEAGNYDRCLVANPPENVAAKAPAAQAVDAREVTLQLLTHIEDVVDDANWERIDPKLWNAVTLKYAASPASVPEVMTDLSAGAATTSNDARDAARLDWLLPNIHPANFGFEFEGGYEWDSEAEFLSKFRKAIDAAMSAHQAKKTEGA
jgi:hypothetical protein